MASPQGDDVEPMEGERIEEEEEVEEIDEVETDDVEEQQEVVDIDAEEENQQEEEGEGVETDEAEQAEEHEVVDVDADEDREEKQEEECEVIVVDDAAQEETEAGQQEHEEADVIVLEDDAPSTERSRANTNALMAANGIVTPARLEEELQCIICQYAMFKPVSALCGHSFCRVCLMDSFLTRPIEEAQCPICRVEILQPFTAKSSLASMFSINVTLWNLAQLLIPSVAARVSSYQQKEEEEFTQKLDQLNAKWKVFTLSERAATYHGDHDADASGRWEDDHEGHEEYPIVKVEDTEDGNLRVSRNIVLDTSDENEDGVMNMRVGMAVVEFPSVFELYNEHQECSVNVIKLEEDEEMADGMPFFMNEDGDDDGFVCSSYYNEISLHVCDEGGNCVMERTRGAQGGVVTFPGLRLDVPSGTYTFRFSDDLYGLKLSITTRLREPHEISDTPVADFVSLIHDEARDADRRGRGRQHDSDNEAESGEESDDSFIVDDLHGEAHNEEPVGSFSDEEGHWQYHEDDEAADERREQRRVRRRQRSERDVQFVDEGEELSGEENEHAESSGPEDAGEHEDEGEEDDDVRPGRRNVRLVEEAADSSDGEDAGQEDRNEVEEPDEQEGQEQEAHADVHEVARTRRRNANHIMDSEDENEGEPGGSDDEQKENDIPDAAEDEDDEIADGGEANEDASDDNEQDATPRNAGRKVKRTQWFQGDDDSEEEHGQSPPDALLSPDEDVEVPASRPRKRPRAQGRQVRVIDVAESDEEQEQMERSIMTANSAQDGDDASDDADSDSQFQRVHQLFDEEVDERNELDDAQQDEFDTHDYPDEEIDNDENDDY